MSYDIGIKQVVVTGSNLRNPLVTKLIDFAGKTSGQTFDVPHVAYLKGAATFDAPSTFTGEFNAPGYTGLLAQGDGQSAAPSYSVNAQYAQSLFKFDILNDLKIRGLIPKSWTVTDLKANLKAITMMWAGYGVGANATVSTNGVNLKLWNATTNGWGGAGSNTAASPSPITTATGIDYIDANGNLHLLAHSTYPSDGTIASTIYTDYVKVDVQLYTEQLDTPGRFAPDGTQQIALAGNTVPQVDVLLTLAGQSIAAGATAWFPILDARQYVALSMASWWSAAPTSILLDVSEATHGNSGTDLYGLTPANTTVGLAVVAGKTPRKVGQYASARIVNNHTAAQTLSGAEIYGWRA